ncbi:hypothetical protein [Thalassotalea aquiviva]|uniref:hypothetical protein n=1 Tax=Thalassotalea aquiviva TaxID=3242415 RepID=UPI00352BAA9F
MTVTIERCENYSKFDHLRIDPCTKIIKEQKTQIAGFKALLQTWQFEGITAQSFIFVSREISMLSEEEIKAIVMACPSFMKGSEITISEIDNDYTFVNFNFLVK